jgi:uncharacterized protein (UPF0305 family)
VKKTCAELEAASEKSSHETQKRKRLSAVMDRFMNLSKEKEAIINYNKKMVMHLHDIKKKNEAVIESQKAQKKDYQKKFDKIMKDLEQDYEYDEGKCQHVASENQR